jgi:predicted DsbA family dithiol-disulfide isomerase
VRLRELMRDAPAGVHLRHKAFLLRPEDNPVAQFSAYQLQHRQAARQMTGLEFHLPQVGAAYPRSSLPALEAAKWVEALHPERFLTFDLALFQAFFAETRDISDPAVLVEVAHSAGIPGAGLEEALTAGSYRAAVWSDHREAMELGVNSIPTVRIGEAVISGAVPFGEYRAALTEALARGRTGGPETV